MIEPGRLKFVCGLFRVPTDEYLAVARAAEAAGFEALALSDHIVHLDRVESRFPYTEDGERPWSATDDYPDVWVATAMMAAITQRLRFLQAIYVLPARDPFSIAKALGTLARMSRHRVSLGFGVGWMREEFDLMGQAFEGRGRRSEEMIELMQKLWTGDVVDHEGEATLEAYTVMFGGDGPERAYAAFLLPDGRRTWANSEDLDLAAAMTREEFCGRQARIDGRGSFEVV